MDMRGACRTAQPKGCPVVRHRTGFYSKVRYIWKQYMEAKPMQIDENVAMIFVILKSGK